MARKPYNEPEYEEAEGKSWYLVIYANTNGWVSSKYAELVE